MTAYTPMTDAERAVVTDVFRARTMEEEAAELAADSEAATVLMRADPRLSPISALIIARDRAHAARVWTLLERGVAWQHAVPYAGSYARLDLMVRAAEAGYMPRADLLAALPDEWSGSDPDDTDPRFLALWREAWLLNGQHYVRQKGGRPLPRARTLRAYRGQDDDAPFGIAWSLDPKVAEKFARGAATRQSNRGGRVFAVDVPRGLVFGYMTGRGESEVIFDPSGLRPVVNR